MTAWPGAHPRVCGENLDPYAPETWWQGSSPRVRGKQPRWRERTMKAGLIPACAGKTRVGRPNMECLRAHPRVCGENGCWRRAWRLVVGSSPRVRGKLYDGINALSKRRLIPACAGKTNGPNRKPVQRAAHPRVCGENGMPKIRAICVVGSSPRVRGKRTRC